MHLWSRNGGQKPPRVIHELGVTLSDIRFTDFIEGEPEAVRCPHLAFADPTSKATASVVWSEPWRSWVVTRYADIIQILRDTKNSSALGSGEPRRRRLFIRKSIGQHQS